jgi:hypothetical protein
MVSLAKAGRRPRLGFKFLLMMGFRKKIWLAVFSLSFNLRSFCLDAKRTKKIKANPNGSACFATHAQHHSSALSLVYGSLL